MMRKNPDGRFPYIDKTAYIDSTAIIIGNVKIGKNVFVGPGAVIRADEPGSSIIIKNNCNIQDRAVIHALSNSGVIIKEKTSLSHGCIVHGPCGIGRNCFIGFGSVVFKAAIKDNVFIKSLAVIEGVNVPDEKFIPNGAIISSPRAVESLQSISKEERTFAKRVTETNLRLVKGYKKDLSCEIEARNEKLNSQTASLQLTSLMLRKLSAH